MKERALGNEGWGKALGNEGWGKALGNEVWEGISCGDNLCCISLIHCYKRFTP